MSILPDEDADEAYCHYHTRPMSKQSPLIQHNGAVYGSKDPFDVYVCTECLHLHSDYEPLGLFKLGIGRLFEKWDDRESEGDWFRYVGEAEHSDYKGVIRFD